MQRLPKVPKVPMPPLLQGNSEVAKAMVASSYMGRSEESLLYQMRGMLQANEEITRDIDVWIVPMRLYAWLQARGHDRSAFRPLEFSDTKARAEAQRLANEYREALYREALYGGPAGGSMAAATPKPKEPEAHPWDVRRIDLD